MKMFNLSKRYDLFALYGRLLLRCYYALSSDIDYMQPRVYKKTFYVLLMQLSKNRIVNKKLIEIFIIGSSRSKILVDYEKNNLCIADVGVA